jgi:hypothetical protein
MGSVATQNVFALLDNDLDNENDDPQLLVKAAKSKEAEKPQKKEAAKQEVSKPAGLWSRHQPSIEH